MNRLRNRLILVFVAATVVPLAVTLWVTASLLDRSLSYAPAGELDELSKSLETVGREFYQQARSELKRQAAAGAIQPVRYAEATRASWPAAVREFAVSPEVERFVLAGDAGDCLELLERHASASSTPAMSTPASSTPASSTPAMSAPASSAPASSAPASSAPASSTPASSAPASSTPASSAPASSAPASSVLASSTPAFDKGAVDKGGTDEGRVDKGGGNKGEVHKGGVARNQSDQAEVWVYTMPLGEIHMGRLADQYRRARALVVAGRTRDLRRGFLYTYILLAAAIWMVALGVLAFLAHRVSRPIQQITAGLDQLASGNLAARVEDPRWVAQWRKRDDEIGRAIQAFNHTAAQLQQNRDRLVYLTQLASWRTLARKMAHEVKNSLTPIRLTMEEMLARGDGDRAFLEQASQIVVDEVESLERRVRAFSEFAAEPPVQPGPVDVNALVEERIAFLRKAHPEVTYSVRLHGGRPQAFADGDLVKGILTNLLENAAEAAGTGGKILVATETDDSPPKTAGARIRAGAAASRAAAKMAASPALAGGGRITANADSEAGNGVAFAPGAGEGLVLNGGAAPASDSGSDARALESRTSQTPHSAAVASPPGTATTVLTAGTVRAGAPLERSAGPALTAACPAPAGKIAIEVYDSGPGLSGPARESLFQPTISFKKHGMGLGLSIARKSALLLGGDIVLVESVLGGAGFRVLLPVALHGAETNSDRR